jgi:putative selenate reductase molybdopterin-binding subunit
VTVDELVMAVDSGVIINPVTASGQIEGGMVQAAGYGVCEEMAFDDQGRNLNPRFGPYWIYRADDVPRLTTIFVETHEESGPFGAKAVAEIPLDGAGPAIANAVYDAVGVRIKDAPLYPEKVWRAL